MKVSRQLEILGPLLVDERRLRLDEVAASRLGGIVVVLENLEDPHNGAAAMRSIEAAGLREVHVVEGVERFRFSERVTQGCDKWIDLSRHRRIEDCAEGLKARGFRLCAAVPGASVSLFELDPSTPTAFLLGNERVGLTDRARALSDVEFGIPLRGFSESVNLSVATALCVFTHAERRRQSLGRLGDLDEAALEALRAEYYRLSVRGADTILAAHATAHHDDQKK